MITQKSLAMSNTFNIDSDNPLLRMHECGANEYWFYHKGSYPQENPLLYQQIIDNATSEIIIWDPYFNIQDNDQNIFLNIDNNITIKILTSKSIFRNTTYLNDLKNALKMIITESKNCRFGLRVINETDPHNHGGRFFHDRFLIIDDTDIYLIGSSIGYHLKSQQSTGIFKVLNFDTKTFIKSIFKHYWDNSNQNEIPVSYLHL